MEAADPPDPVQVHRERVRKLVSEKDYDTAIEVLRDAIRLAPNRPELALELAYILLKTGENEAARDTFAAVMKAKPDDPTPALEYAFLCFETKEQRTARLVFDRIRKTTKDATARTTAEQAFQNIDGPLAEGIARWTRVLQTMPEDFSAHLELARLAEQRDELSLAAQHYDMAWRRKPAMRSLLLDLGRVWRLMGQEPSAQTAFLAASRASEPRTAELAREFLPRHYPYASEFEAAIALDTANVELRREYGFFLCALGKNPEAEAAFTKLLEIAPGDLLSVAQLGLLKWGRNDRQGAMPLFEKILGSQDYELADRVRRVLNPKRPQSQWKPLAEKSYALGYMKDAQRYLEATLEDDPGDLEAALKLGFTLNMLRDDAGALRYFDKARQSTDPEIREQAGKAYRNLKPSQARVQTTLWTFPFFSTRWHDLFNYGQLKAEFRLGHLPLHPYLSARFVGDSRGASGALTNPTYLSESSFLVGGGLRTGTWHGLMAWGEAGSAIRYRHRTDVGRMVPDYRAGLSYSKGFGKLLSATERGVFYETNADAVFLSRFANDFLVYAQHRAGYTLPKLPGNLQAQVFVNGNFTVDQQRQAWANTVEYGPGIRWRFKGMPKAMSWSANFLRGNYLITAGNPLKPVYYDVRIGVWYAHTY